MSSPSFHPLSTSTGTSRIVTALVLFLSGVLPPASPRLRAADVPLTVVPAVELRFQPVAGTAHQLQSSTDLATDAVAGRLIALFL